MDDRLMAVPTEDAQMQRKIGKTLLLSLIPLLLVGANAVGDGVAVKITNDSTEDIVVTVYDMTIGPNAVVLAHARINGFTAVPVSVAPDGSGRANLSWTAITADATARKCGHEDSVVLPDSSSLTVHADANCSRTG
jgi:hypothetical protein